MKIRSLLAFAFVISTLYTTALGQEHRKDTQNSGNGKLFELYVGRYEFAPNVIMTVTNEDDHLFTQVTGQRKIEIFPESERDFVARDVDAKITFEVDGDGRATALVVHQAGREMRATRIK